MPHDTYDRFILHQILVAPPGWRAVFRDTPDSPYHAHPIDLFGLVTRRAYWCAPRSGRALVLEEEIAHEEEVGREVVGLIYYQVEGFCVVNEMFNFVGLCPPEQPLEAFVAAQERHEG